MKWNAEDTMNWLRRDHSASKEDYMVCVWFRSVLYCMYMWQQQNNPWLYKFHFNGMYTHMFV